MAREPQRRDRTTARPKAAEDTRPKSDAKRRGTVIREAVFEGDRQLRRTAFRYGEDFRDLRRRTGVTQAAVARAIGVDRSVVCRLEAGDAAVTATVRARAAHVLGATFKLAIYHDGTPLIHDAAHARIVERLLALRHPRWQATVEAPIPGLGHRSSDVRLKCGHHVVLVEVETRIHRLEEIVRELHDKRAAVLSSPDVARDLVHVMLVLPPTRHHRALVKSHPETIASAFPGSPTVIRAALAAPAGDWPGDGLLWIGAGGTND